MLNDMLQFNPFFRPTAKELLQQPIFNQIRVPGLEASAPFKVNIDIDRNEFQFNYETNGSELSGSETKFILNSFKKFVIDEISKL